MLARDWAGTAITAYPGLPFFRSLVRLSRSVPDRKINIKRTGRGLEPDRKGADPAGFEDMTGRLKTSIPEMGASISNIQISVCRFFNSAGKGEPCEVWQ